MISWGWVILFAALVVEDSVHVFPDPIPEGDTARAFFILKNDGKDTLWVESIRPDCGCTTAPLKSRAIPPDGILTLPVEYHTLGRPGPFEKKIWVHTSDSSHPGVVLRIRGEVRPTPKPVIHILNRRVDLGKVRTGDTVRISLAIRNEGERDLHIQRVNLPTGDFTLQSSLPLTIPPGRVDTLHIRFVPTKYGLFQNVLEVYSDDPWRPSRFVGIQARVRASESEPTPSNR